MAVGTPTYGALTLDTASPVTATAPTRSVGDKLVCVVHLRGSTSASPSITTPSGWTQVGSLHYGTSGAGRGIAVYERSADGTSSDDFSASFSMSGTGFVLSACIVAFPGGGTVTMGTVHTVDVLTQDILFGADATLPGDGAVLAVGVKTDDCTSVSALSGTNPTFTNISWIDDSARDDLTFSLDYALGTGSSVALGTTRTMVVSGGTTDYTSAAYVIIEAASTSVTGTGSAALSITGSSRTEFGNFFPHPEPTVSLLSLSSGATDTTAPSGAPTAAAWIQMAARGASDLYAYELVPLSAGSTTYRMAVDVEMQDGLQPTLATNTGASGDFAFIVGGNSVTASSISYSNVGGNVWKTTALVTTIASPANTYFGLYRHSLSGTDTLKFSNLELHKWITGTGSATLAITGTASGTHTPFAGTGAATLAITGSASGARGAAGTAAATLAITGSGAGVRGASGTASATLAITGAGSGVRGAAGTAAATLAITGSAAGTHTPYVGTGAATLAITGSGVGEIGADEIVGTGAATLDLTGSGEGTAYPNIIGTAAATLDLQASGSGAHGVSGSAATTLADVVGSGAGARGSAGSGAVSFSITGSATGQFFNPITGVGSATFTITGAGVGGLTIGGLGEATFVLVGSAAGLFNNGWTPTVQADGVWSPVSQTDGTWTPVAQASGEWSPVSQAGGSWSPVSTSPGSWTDG